MLVLTAHEHSFAQYKLLTDLNPNEKIIYDKSLEQFNNEDYGEAYKGFSQLLSLHPREEVFNFYFGACLVSLNNNLKSGIEYLEYAAGKGIYHSYFYIGLGHHYQYDFENAISYYEKYKSNAKKREIVNFEINQYISMAKNGIDLVQYAYELKLISSKRISRKNFHYSYNLSDFGGNIIVKTDQFMGKADKSIRETDLMYISDVHNVLFFSSYGDNKKNSLDIYVSRKSNNTWSAPQRLPDNINTVYDEAFPFLSEDGISLYFSSKGHSSMGGYDIFVSEWDQKTNSWSEPKNLDFPINSPFDDIMYAIDRYNETAFFASNRSTKDEQIEVFRILSENNPQKRKLDNMSDVRRNASLQISPMAVTELQKRQELRTTMLTDTSSFANNNIPANVGETDADVEIQKLYEKLDQNAEIANEYLEYAAAAFTLTENRLAEIKKHNRQLATIKSKNDQNSVQIRDSLNALLNSLSLEATELHEISNFFFNNARQINGIVTHYRSEVKILDNTPRNDNALLGNIEKLNEEISRITPALPIEEFTSQINSEITQKEQRQNSYTQNLNQQFEILNDLNNKIETRFNLAKNEPDYDVREKYIYDIKSFENNKIDAISRIKNDEVQKEFLIYEINALQQKNERISKFAQELDDNLIYLPDLNIAKLNNEIDLLKSSVTQNALKELALIQDKILADNKYYSKIVDYDAVLYDPSLFADSNENFVIPDDYTNKYSTLISDKTKNAAELINANDSISLLIKIKEEAFDSAESNIQKQELISEINNLNSLFKQNQSTITSNLEVETQTNIEQLREQINDIKSNSSNSLLYADQITKTENLIAESRKLDNDIEDLKLLEKNEESTGVLFLQAVKADIDKQVAENIYIINQSIANEEKLVDINKIIAEVVPQSKNNNQAHKSLAQEVSDNFSKANSLIEESNKLSDVATKNRKIDEANTLVEQSLADAEDVFNTLLITQYADYLRYTQAIEKYKLLNQTNEQVYKNAIQFKQKADKLQLDAEETPDEKAKLEKYAQAWKEMELANMNLVYFYEISSAPEKYEPNKTFSVDDSFEDLLSLAASSKILQSVEEPEIIITDYNTDVINSLIAEADIIQTQIDALKTEFENSNPNKQDEILKRIKDLNEQLSSSISRANDEIVKAQKEIISKNLNQLANEGEDEGVLTSIKKEVEEYSDLAEKYFDSKDFYMLGEVLIAGENLLKKQNDRLKNKTILNLADAKINNLMDVSLSNNKFVSEKQLIASNTNSETDTVKNQDIETAIVHNNTQSDIIINTDNSTENIVDTVPFTETDILVVNVDSTENLTDSLDINILVNNQTSTDTIPIQNDISVVSNTSDNNNAQNIKPENEFESIDNFIAVLADSGIDGSLPDKSVLIAQLTEDVNENTTNINALKQEIESSNRNKTKERLNQELRQAEREQSDKLIQLSTENIAYIDNLDIVFRSGFDNENYSADTTLIRLIAEQKQLRSSIINYNNFYSTDELLETHTKALKTEQDILSLMLSKASDFNPELVANNYSPSNNLTIDKNNYQDLDEGYEIPQNYEFSYDLDKASMSKLDKLEISLNKSNEQIVKIEKQIADKEIEMDASNTLSERKKRQNDLEKLNRNLLKEIKNATSINMEYLSLKYSIADTYYADNLLPADNKIRQVSDSLKSLSDNDYAEAIELLELVAAYNSKIADSDLIKKFKEANNSVSSSISKINYANNLNISNDYNNPVVLSYYKPETKQTDVEILVDNNTTIVNNDLDNTIDNTIDNTTKSDTIETNTESVVKTDAELISVLRSENNVFDETLESQYSDANPILVMEAGEELSYRIQIGAYYQPVNNDRFSGMSPIFMEKVEGSQLLRYMVGLFYTYNSANTNLPIVRRLGYADAYIVAYYNGQRITVYEARRIEERLEREAAEAVIAFNQTPEISTENANNEQPDTQIDNNDLATNTGQSDNTEQSSQITVTDLKKTTDVFFCVQIGVYREKIGSERLYNLDPIMYDEYGNGLIRHCFGKYYDLNTAIAEQNKIRALGIRDAFVIAYNNGEKIAVNQATNLIAQKDIVPTDQIVVNVPVVVQADNLVDNPNPNIAENPVVNDVREPIAAQQSKPTYYVQLGVFKTDIGNPVKDVFRRISASSKLIRLIANDMIIYRVGDFNSYAEALVGLNNAKSAGVNDAFVIAIIDGKRVNIATALEAEK